MVCVGTSCGSAEDIFEIGREVFWLDKSPEVVQVVIPDHRIGYSSLAVSMDRLSEVGNTLERLFREFRWYLNNIGLCWLERGM